MRAFMGWEKVCWKANQRRASSRDVQIKREHNGLDASSRQLQCPWDGRCWLVVFYGTAVRVPVVTVLDVGAKHVSVEKPGGGVRWLWDGWGRGREGELRRDEWNNAADVPVISWRPWRLITQLVLRKRRWLLIKSARVSVCMRHGETTTNKGGDASESIPLVFQSVMSASEGCACVCLFHFNMRLIKPKAQSWGDMKGSWDRLIEPQGGRSHPPHLTSPASISEGDAET